VTLGELSKAMGWTNLTPELDAVSDPDVASGYASDLLSDVLANAPESGVWVTVQVHLNVVAVAAHTGLAAVVFAARRRPEESVRLKAVEEKVRLFTSSLSAFDVIGRLYEAGVRGGPA
jgi:hypothetical protein